MATIKLYTQEGELFAESKPAVSSGNIESVKLKVSFDSSWDGYSKTAVFRINEGEPIERVLVNDECTLPFIGSACSLFIGVKGVKANGETRTTYFIRYNIRDGANGFYVYEPTDEIYKQILTAYGATQTALAVERARINNLAKLKEGSTTGDAELLDMRVDYTGKTHDTAGGAVREQIAPIAAQVKAKNLIDYRRLTRGYISADGWITNYNNGFVLNHEVTSDYITLKAAQNYYFAHNFNEISAAIRDGMTSGDPNYFSVSLFDSDRKFIKRLSYNAQSIVIKSEALVGAIYARVSYRTYMFNRPIFAACGVACEPMDEITTADNLLETYPMIFNGYVNSTNGAVIGTTHTQYEYVPTEQNELTSDFIPCKGGEEMFVFATATESNFVRFGFYKADGSFISSFSYSDTAIDKIAVRNYNNLFKVFTVPEDAAALRVSCRGAYIVECVLAYNDEKRRYLRKECERKHKSKTMFLQTIPPTVKGVAHRGLSTEAPENTLAAYRLAKKAGFAYVECDVSFTSDGYAVLLHDGTIDRTSNGTGNIADLTLEAVRALDFGAWKGAEYAGEKIPRFEEFILLCKRLGLHPYIELKTGTEEQIKALVDVVKRYGMKDKVSWISFTSNYLVWVKAANPAARLGYVVSEVTSDIINTAKSLKQNAPTMVDGALVASGNCEVFIDCAAANANAAAVELCKNADFPLEVWTVNSESEILALDPYISGVTSDSIIAAETYYNSEALYKI